MNKSIKTTRKYEIKRVIFSNDGNFIATTGTGQDTAIQIFDANKKELIEIIDTAGVKIYYIYFNYNNLLG
jgi:hypothetical protein